MAASPSFSSLPFKVTKNVPYCWCDTDINEIKFGYIWTIKKFSYLQEAAGQCIESSKFGYTEDDTSKWCLSLYPRGWGQNENEHFVSLYLTHIPSDDKALEVSAVYEFSILNHKREKCCIIKENKAFKKASRVSGYQNFVRRDRLLNENNGLLQNNELILCCEVVIYTQTKSSVRRSEPTSFKDSGCAVVEDLSRLLESNRFSDIVLVAEDKELRAHRTILAARSRVFAAMFEHDMVEKQENKVVISDVDYDVLEELVRFIYNGKIPDADEKMATRLLAAADKYGLDELKMACEQTLSVALSAENVAELVGLASLHNAEHLTNRLVEFMKSFAMDDIITRLWRDIITQHPQIVAKAFQDCQMNQVNKEHCMLQNY